jgi:hypothetical protein
MPKFLLSLVIVFSLLFAPLAHAAGLDCLDFGKSGIEKVEAKSDSKSEKQTDKFQKNANHCCCSHTTCDRITAKAPDYLPSVSTVAIPATDDNIASVSYGPPLEPPSHA